MWPPIRPEHILSTVKNVMTEPLVTRNPEIMR